MVSSPTSTALPSPQPSRSSSQHSDSGAADSIPVETLVQHLLDAKRSLSSMTLVLQANEVVTAARQAHEESVILGAQSQFLRRGISDQAQLLLRARKSMNQTYDRGKREFKKVLKSLDAANDRLGETMGILRGRIVERAFRPSGEEQRDLLHFVDVAQVDTMQNSLKENIAALQATQTSFDGDLLRFDTDMRTLSKTMKLSSLPLSPSASSAEQPVDHILESMVSSSHEMARSLTSLTKHFDLCVTAVRTTEGGAALAKRKAAEVTQSQGGEDVSISGIIAEQESDMEIDAISHDDRAQMMRVVMQDAAEVPDVVQEINDHLQSILDDFARLDEQTNQVKRAYLTTLEAFHILEDIGSRLLSYIAAETEFRERWGEEHETIIVKMMEMEELRMFYENYASSYDSLILEVDRRRAHEDKILSILKKAKDSVDKIIESDRRQREAFRQEVAEYIPTDLWPGMDDGLRRWDVVPIQGESRVDGSGSMPALDRSVVQAAAVRLGRTSPEW